VIPVDVVVEEGAKHMTATYHLQEGVVTNTINLQGPPSVNDTLKTITPSRGSRQNGEVSAAAINVRNTVHQPVRPLLSPSLPRPMQHAMWQHRMQRRAATRPRPPQMSLHMNLGYG